MRLCLSLSAMALLLSLAAGGVIAEEKSKSVIGLQVEDFTLRDFRGKQHKLSDYAENKFIVLAMMGTECPLAKLYAPRLESLSIKYKQRGVAFLGLNPNVQDSVKELAAYARIHKLTFPLLKDAGNKIADRLSAERTPEVYVLDQDRKIRYRGRIDDQYGVGYVRTEPKRNDLAAALDELLGDKKVSRPEIKAVGCIIGRVRKIKPRGDVTYSNQISRLLQRNCVSCHRPGEIAPFPLMSYDEVVGWAEMMLEVVEEQRMPPWNANPEIGHFKNDPRLSDKDKELLFTWVENGCPEGDPKQLPESRKFQQGWSISKPDAVFTMPKPFQVPAEGAVEYKYFMVDPGFKEDKWIKMAEARPGNRSVVHHILVFVRAPGERRGLQRTLVGFAPGTPARIYPKGAAKRIPAGSKLIFQLHYTPNGSPQEDLSSVGVVFADPEEVTLQVTGGMAMNRNFRIPANADDHQVVSRYVFRNEHTLLSMSPHMHLRGKDFRFVAEYPDGKREVLLDVPRYDFNWQLRYDLAKPKIMPAGTKLVCTAHFDNSERNLSNPDPTKEVRWGDQTWEEMMIGWFTSTVKRRQ